MFSLRSHTKLRVFSALLVSLVFCFQGFAQDDTDPNSPIPVLLTGSDTKRVLAISANSFGRRKGRAEEAFAPGSTIVMFVTNVDLMEGEGANAFRLYVEDRNGRTYRFPVTNIEPVKGRDGVFAVTVVLQDEIGYWETPTPDGDVLVRLTWRGHTSERLRLGYGATGGEFKNKQTSAEVYKTDGDAPTSEYVGYRWSGDRRRFLEQAAFGSNELLDQRIRRIGLRTWLAEQFEAPYPSLSNPYPNQPLKPGNAPADCDGSETPTPDVPITCFRDTYTMYPLQTWFMKEAFYSDAQLKHRVAWALSQIWVTSGVDIQQSRHMVEWHKVLSRNAFGNYRNLMEEMTLHPTMGEYLSMNLSTRTNPNENYAREIMQLFTIGLFMLNQDGTLQTSGGNPIPTYDQNGVNNLTKVFTGWKLCNIQGASCPNIAVGTENYIDPMLLNRGVTNVNNNQHDLTAKTLLNYPGSTTTNIAACTNCTTLPNISTYAYASMDQALDNMYNHPNVGPFVSKIMIQHMVTSDPSPAYVGRVASVFNANRTNPSQMKEVVKAILLDPEARGDVKTDPNYGKLREPVQLTTNILRTFNVAAASGTGQSDGYLTGRQEFNGMAQIPFRSPTVFNYFPPDFVVPNTSLLGPEFALMTTGTTIQRANFVNRFVFTAPPIGVSVPNSPNGTSLNFSDLQELVVADTSNNLMLDALNQRMLHGTMSPAMRSTIMTAVNSITVSSPPTAAQTLSRVRQAVYLVATSSQYQVQR